MRELRKLAAGATNKELSVPDNIGEKGTEARPLGKQGSQGCPHCPVPQGKARGGPISPGLASLGQGSKQVDKHPLEKKGSGPVARESSSLEFRGRERKARPWRRGGLGQSPPRSARPAGGTYRGGREGARRHHHHSESSCCGCAQIPQKPSSGC